MRVRIALPALLLALAVGAARAADPPAAVTREFKLDVTAEVDATVGGKKGTVTAAGTFRYAWTRQADESTLRLRGLRLKATADRRPLMDASMSRERIVSTADGKTTDTKFDDAPDELKTMLRDTFDTPLCKVVTDAAGRETKRTLVAGDGAKELVDDAMVANTLLFHPPFVAGQKAWTAKVGVSAGQGLATGELTYTPTPGGKGGQLVKVSGTLTADGVDADNGYTVKGGKYVVRGTQTYDPERKEWVAGEMDMDMTFTLVRGKEMLPATGNLKATFELLPEKKK